MLNKISLAGWFYLSYIPVVLLTWVFSRDNAMFNSVMHFLLDMICYMLGVWVVIALVRFADRRWELDIEPKPVMIGFVMGALIARLLL